MTPLLLAQTSTLVTPAVRNPFEPFSGDNTQELVQNAFEPIFEALTVLIGACAVIFLIYNGLRYISSAGDPAKAKTAKAGVVYALIGVFIATTAYLILSIGIFGSQFLATTFSK
jgi:hypothetical protein